MDSTTPAKKLLALKAYLNNLNSVAIAFSSGVDSTFLLKVAHDVLGDQVVAVTARSCSFPVRELKEAQQAQSPKDGRSVPGVFETPTRSRSAKRLVGGKSAKSSSFTSGQISP